MADSALFLPGRWRGAQRRSRRKYNLRTFCSGGAMAVVFSIGAIVADGTPACAQSMSEAYPQISSSASQAITTGKPSRAAWTVAFLSTQGADAQPQSGSQSSDAPGAPAANAGTVHEAASGGGLAVKINNPVTDLWLIETEFNNLQLKSDPRGPVSGQWVNISIFRLYCR